MKTFPYKIIFVIAQKRKWEKRETVLWWVMDIIVISVRGNRSSDGH